MHGPKIQRRTLAKGVAWAVPAVAVAAAAPAYAKSGRPPSIQILNGCKQPGESCAPEFSKGYTFTVRVSNPTGETMWVYLPSATPTPSTYSPYFQYTSGVQFSFGSAREYFPGNPDTLDALVNPLQLTPGQTRYIAVDGGATGNSANTFASGVLWLAWGHNATAGLDTMHPYTPSPWATPQVTPFGEGWIGGSFSIAAFDPCDKKNNCIPTSTPVTTTTTTRPVTTTTTTPPPAGKAAAADTPGADTPGADTPAADTQQLDTPPANAADEEVAG